MTGFSPDWLALREPADRKARNPRVLGTCIEHFQACEFLHIADLGCGTGSSLRALSPHLPPRQFWRLVDHDPKLLAAARAALLQWSDGAQDNGPDLVLTKAGKTIHVCFCQADLAGDVAGALGRDTELVTAAALFDLCSTDWIARFVDVLAARKLNLYTVLTYNGEETWSPPHVADAAMLSAFLVHQQTDKGFGRASGPHAPDCLIRQLACQNFGLVAGDSPWMLGPQEGELIAALANGSADAVAETGMVEAGRVESWRAARRLAERCEIGHVDIFAVTA